jgi:hypothetical protein
MRGSLADTHALTKADLVQVMTFKLARGEYRPALLGLIESNTEAAVRGAAAESLSRAEKLSAAFPSDGPSPEQADTKCVLEPLCALKGVGPATASLILSVLVSASGRSCALLPFASDETLRFALSPPLPGSSAADEAAATARRSKIKLSYCQREFAKLVSVLWGLRRNILKHSPADGGSTGGTGGAALPLEDSLTLAVISEALWAQGVIDRVGAAASAVVAAALEEVGVSFVGSGAAGPAASADASADVSANAAAATPHDGAAAAPESAPARSKRATAAPGGDGIDADADARRKRARARGQVSQDV